MTNTQTPITNNYIPMTNTPSQIRYQHALDIATICPDSLFVEIALTGSSARGIATADSDIEINFWVQQMPSIEARSTWVQSLPVQNIVVHQQARPDNSYWINASYEGIELELGWQTIADLDTSLTALIEAQTTDHKALRLAELVLSAKSLRGSGVLEQWQERLKNYPPTLSDKLIHTALTDWLGQRWLDNAQTDDSVKNDVHRIWRIIFAVNHQWEINWKYAHHSLPNLKIYPKNIASAIWDISHESPQSTLKLRLQLIQKTILLLENHSQYDDLRQENLQLCEKFLAQT